MEISSSLSTTSTTYLRPSTEALLFRRIKLHLGLPISLNRRDSLSLLTRPCGLVHKVNSIKVLCSQKREIPVVEAGSMDEIYDALAIRLLPTAPAASNPNFKHIVALAGPPGAGKSTLASEIVHRVNRLWPQKASSFDSQVKPPDVAAVLPMDGFHLYRSQLDAMENPEEAHARRGAPWTFSPTLLLRCLEKLRNEGSVYAPSFDHGVGDPVEDDIFVSLQHKVVIVEGNYLLLEDGAWKDVSSMFDEKWFIDVDTDTERQIVLNRHFERKASGCFKMAIHIPRSRANFSSKNRKRWQIGVQISKQQKPKITCGLRVI